MEIVVAAGQLLILSGFCLGIYKIANGRLSKKVSQDTCKANVDGIHALLKEHAKHIDIRFDDLKDTIEKKQ